MLKQVVEFIVQELVDDKTSVNVTQERQDKKLTIAIHVHPNDFGKVIGKSGKTIRSIRSLVSTLNKEKDDQVFVDIIK